MKNKSILLFLVFSSLSFIAQAQIWNGKDTLYGNEWINYSQKYYKMKIAADGLYRLDYSTLSAAGVPLATVKGADFKVFALGKEVPLYTSNANLLQNNDYLEFFAKKNRGELDAELFVKPTEEQMNPNFSMFNDTISYFLTWSNAAAKNYTDIANNINNPPTKESYYLHRYDSTFVSFDLNAGGYDKKYYKADGDKIYNSIFEKTEGFASNYANSRKITLPLTGLVKNVSAAKVNLRLGFRSNFTGDATSPNDAHKYSIKWNNTLMAKDSFANEFNLKNVSFDVEQNLLNNNSELSFEHTFAKDGHRIATLEVIYPKNFDFENKKSYTFEIAAAANARYIEIQNFDVSGNSLVLYDLSNNLRLLPLVENNLVKFVLPASTNARKLLLINTNAIKKAQLNAYQFLDVNKIKANYVIISNPVLFNDPKTGTNWVQEYANYRNSVAGGSYFSAVIEQQQIYDQFAYGIDHHAIANRNFALFAAKNWKAKYLLLIGKGLEYREARDPKYFSNFGSHLTVATFGFPGSDNLISATKWNISPQIATGRIPADVPDDIRIYLKKIKEHEQVQKDAKQTIEDKLWVKNVIHMAGDDGNFNAVLSNMGDILAQNMYGAKVTQFYKSSTDPVQSSNSELLRERIKKGVSIVNYYGHSASTNVGYSLDGPSELDNKGKYFLYLAHGCYTGQIHVPSKTIGPSYIFQEDEAAISFCAPTSYGLTGMLDNFGNTFYAFLGGKDFGKGLGDVMKSVITSNSQNTWNFPILNNMTLQGDPALVLNNSLSPDYIIDASSVKFEPEVVTTLTDKFKIKYTAYNLGKDNNENFSISLFRELPDGSKIFVKKDTIKGLKYGVDLSFDVAGLGENSAGLNKFFFKIDADDKVIELPAAAELNNSLEADLRIRSNDVNLIAPQNYAIVNQAQTLVALTATNNLNLAQKYLLEIDTTANFNSPLKLKQEIIQKSGLLTWKPAVNYLDSTVYYWRVTADSTNIASYNWKVASFIYMKNVKEGWNQSHFFQFLNDDFNFIDLLKKDRRFSYQGNSTGVAIRNNYEDILRPGVGINEVNSSFFKPTLLQGEGAGVLCWVFNDTTGLPWVNKLNGGKGLYNSDLNGTTYQPKDYFFPYRTTQTQTRADLMNFLEKVVPSKSYVVFMLVTTKAANYKPELWAADSTANGGKNIFNVLEKQGAKLIRNTLKVGAVPYFYFYRKDDPIFNSNEKIYDLNKPDQPIAYSTEIKGFWYKGSVKSTTIGPASKWNTILWNQSEVEAKDTTYLNVYGVKTDKKEDILFKKTVLNNIDITNLDSKKYPYLKLEWYSRDSFMRSSPQLKYWRVLHTGVPESVPNTAKLFNITADTVQQGQAFNIAFAIQNVSQYDMKDLLVRYTLKKSDNSKQTFYQKLKPLLNGDTLISRMTFDTKVLEGKNTITIQVNPNNDQIEQDTTNNGVYYEFFVEKDKRNPALDITFDGQRILNGDIVSPEPNIVIQLRDENKFLLLNDTSLFRVYLRKPNDINAIRIPFDNALLKFTPAVSSKSNKATLEFNPIFTEDGDYDLLVKAKDASGNKVAEYELSDKDKLSPDFYNYKVSFKVFTKSSISNVLNYPNPFTTSTKFVYTLTGKDAPAYFKIQIMTISGKVVRELTQSELGALVPGTHQTDYAWDGTDQFGDRLANGVYLYKLIAKKANGEDYETFQSGADQFMKNGIGKLVILR